MGRDFTALQQECGLVAIVDMTGAAAVDGEKRAKIESGMLFG
jgi:hypothetical protein